MPGFNIQTFPYLIARTQFTVNLIDLKKTQVFPILFDAKPDFDNEFLGTFKDMDGKIGIVYAVQTKD